MAKLCGSWKDLISCTMCAPTHIATHTVKINCRPFTKMALYSSPKSFRSGLRALLHSRDILLYMYSKDKGIQVIVWMACQIES